MDESTARRSLRLADRFERQAMSPTVPPISKDEILVGEIGRMNSSKSVTWG
jgi:hypothetical protein